MTKKLTFMYSLRAEKYETPLDLTPMRISFPSPHCAASIYSTTKLFVRGPDSTIVLH